MPERIAMPIVPSECEYQLFVLQLRGNLKIWYLPQPKTVKVISPPFCDIFGLEKQSKDLSFPLLQRFVFFPVAQGTPPQISE
jgi:hypothetical protein